MGTGMGTKLYTLLDGDGDGTKVRYSLDLGMGMGMNYFYGDEYGIVKLIPAPLPSLVDSSNQCVWNNSFNIFWYTYLIGV